MVKRWFYKFMGASNAAAEDYHPADLKEYWAVFVSWTYRTSAFFLLPIIVYMVVYLSIGVSVAKIIELPELLLISILLFAQSGQRLISRDRSFYGAWVRLPRTIEHTVIGIVIASLLLAVKIVEIERGILLISWFGKGQVALFLIALFHNCYTNVRADAHSGVGAKLLGREKGKSNV
jgi:hypothetical protein